MSSRRSSSLNGCSPKFINESQVHLSRILSTTCSKSSLSTSKSPLEPVSFSCENIQGSSALLASELDKLILVNSELTKEISSWKRKYRECSLLLSQNLPTDTERENINDIYQQKYNKLKSKALDLKKSYKALESIILDKNQEIGAWKDKYEQMEQEYIDQIQNLRNQMEIVLKTHIEKEVTIAMNQLEQDSAVREGNWNALVAKFKESQKEILMYREERDSALRQLEGSALDMNDLQKEIKLLNQEQEKTIKQLTTVKEQLSAKEVNCQSIQTKYTSLNAELEKLRTWTKEQTVEQDKAKQEIEDLKMEKEAILKNLEQTKEQLRAAEVKYKEAQCKFILMSGEKAKGKEAKLNKLQDELTSIEKERDMLVGQVEDLKAELLVAQDKCNRVTAFEDVLKTVSQEKERVLSQLEVVQAQLEERNRNSGEFEMKNSVLNVEIETLQALKKENIARISQLCSDISSVKQEKETIYQQLDQTKREHNKLLNQVELLKENSAKLDEIRKENLALVEQKNKAVKQCEQTKGILSAVEKNYKNIYNNNVILKNQVQGLEAAVNEKNTVLTQLEEAINAKTSEAYAKEIELKSQSDEIQVLREKIQTMNIELEGFKTSQAANQGKTAVYLEEIRKREQTLKNLEDKVQGEISQKMQLEKEISELRVIIRNMEQQVEDIKQEKNMVIEQYEKKIQTISVEIEALKTSQMASEGKTVTYLEEIKKRDQALKELESHKTQLEKEICELNKELEAMRNSQVSSEARIFVYLEEIKKRDEALKDLEVRIQGEVGQKMQLEKEISELKVIASKKEEQCEALKKEKCMMIDQYEKKIQAQVEWNSALVAKEREFKLKIEELGLRVMGNDELDKKVSGLLQENLILRNSANEAQKVQSGLENKLKGLEIIMDQLKIALEGEQEIGGMLRKIEEYKRNAMELGGESGLWKKRYEEQELRTIQEIEKIKREIEGVWKRRMETEIENKNVVVRTKEEEITKERMEREIAIRSLEVKLQTQANKLAENEAERKMLVTMNENLNRQINQLVQEVDVLKKKNEEDIERESRLTTTKLDIEREKRVQMEKELSAIESQFKQKIAASEEQAKAWKLKVEDFEVRQVMFFIEIERLYAINGELIEDINRLTEELREASIELDKNKQMALEVSKAETFGNPQKENFDDAASDLKKQIEGFEKKLDVHFNERPRFSSSMPLRQEDFKIDTPLKKSGVQGLTGSKMNKGQVSSLQKSHAELRDLANKFESEKKSMEVQLAQFKRLVDLNKLEMKRFTESDVECPRSNPLSPTLRFEGDQYFVFEQPIQPLAYSATNSQQREFRSPQYRGDQRDDDCMPTPRVKLFK